MSESSSASDLFCKCGRRATVRVSYTDLNPGRRFHGCEKGSVGCNFFVWKDPPVCPFARAILPNLRRKLEASESKKQNLEMMMIEMETKKSELEMKNTKLKMENKMLNEENKKLNDENKKLGVWITVSWFFFCLYGCYLLQHWV